MASPAAFPAARVAMADPVRTAALAKISRRATTAPKVLAMIVALTSATIAPAARGTIVPVTTTPAARATIAARALAAARVATAVRPPIPVRSSSMAS